MMTNHGRMAMKLKSKPNHPNGKRFTTIEEIKEKSKQELLAIPKAHFRSVSRNGKNAALCILYLRGITLKRTR